MRCQAFYDICQAFYDDILSHMMTCQRRFSGISRRLAAPLLDFVRATHYTDMCNNARLMHPSTTHSTKQLPCTIKQLDHTSKQLEIGALLLRLTVSSSSGSYDKTVSTSGFNSMPVVALKKHLHQTFPSTAKTIV